MSKIISGMFKGIKIKVFPQDGMRPTSCRAKEALFNVIQFDLKDKVFIDLFAGTGQIGIEALSRGVLKCYFVEKSKKTAKILTHNIEKIVNLYHISNFEITLSDVKKFLKNFKNKADILFADAPFDSPVDINLLKDMQHIINRGGIVIIENETGNNPIEHSKPFYLIKRYTYGRISFDFYKFVAE